MNPCRPGNEVLFSSAIIWDSLRPKQIKKARIWDSLRPQQIISLAMYRRCLWMCQTGATIVPIRRRQWVGEINYDGNSWIEFVWIHNFHLRGTRGIKKRPTICRNHRCWEGLIFICKTCQHFQDISPQNDANFRASNVCYSSQLESACMPVMHTSIKTQKYMPGNR